MNKIYKICLFFALFLASASFAWAGFNYDSSNNYFLIDSLLKTGGDYVLVGDALSGYCSDAPEYISQSQCEVHGHIWIEKLKNENDVDSPQFFAISNNLVFPATGSEFEAGPSRKMDKDNFTTSAISVEGTSNFKIDIDTTTGALTMDAPQISIEGLNFKIRGGLSLVEGVPPGDDSIQAARLLTSKILVFPFVGMESPPLVITADEGTILELAGGGGASADRIFTNDSGDIKDLCVKKPLNTSGLDNYYIININSNPGTGNGTRTDCPSGYFVYDLDTDATDGSYNMICCRPDNVNT